MVGGSSAIMMATSLSMLTDLVNKDKVGLVVSTPFRGLKSIAHCFFLKVTLSRSKTLANFNLFFQHFDY
jgi:hypothetical protein